MRLERVVLICLAMAVLAGCAPRTKAPRGWLPMAEDSLQDPYGGWIRLQVPAGTADSLPIEIIREDESAEFGVVDLSPSGVRLIEGEFLGLGADSVYVLAADDSVRAVRCEDVLRAEVAFFDPMTGGVQGWSVFMGLATISNGYFLVFTVPMWMIGGSIAATAQARSAIKTLDDDGWSEIQAYARFPQGTPPGLRGLHLHMRPPPQAGQ